MNGKTTTISTAPPFVLRFSKDERRVFQQNQRGLTAETLRMLRKESSIFDTPNFTFSAPLR